MYILLAQSRQLVSGENLTSRPNIWCLFSTNHYTLYVCKQFCKLKAACVIFQTAFKCLHTIRAHLFHCGEFIRLSDIESHIFLSSSSNVSTTPLWQWVFWQCLPFSWPTLRDKHCRHPIAVIEVVDTFGHSYWATSDKYPSNHFQQLSEEGLSMLVTWICISDGLYDHSANRHMPFLGSKVKRVFQENLLDFHPQHIQG